MGKGDGVGVAAETQDPAAHVRETRQHRARPVVVIQRTGFKQFLAARTAGSETAGRVVVDPCARPGAEDLGQSPYLRIGRGGCRVKGHTIVGGHDHQHGPVWSQAVDQRIEQTICSALDGTDTAQAGMHHDGLITPFQAKPLELPFQ